VGTCLYLTADSLGAELRSVGFEQVAVERRAASTAIERDQGYSAMLFAAATRS
jgi:hypothetical protein